MDCGLGRQVVLAPHAGRHGTGLAVEGDNPGLVPARTLDRRHVETEDVAGLMGTLDVHRGVAVMALDTGSLVSPADLAHFRILGPRNQGYAFAGTEGLGVAKLDLGRPDCTGDVNPVVVRGPLQGFAGVEGAIRLLLFLAVVISRALCVLTLQPLALALPLRLLLVRVRDLGRLDKVVHSLLDWAEDTFVVLHSGQYTDRA